MKQQKIINTDVDCDAHTMALKSKLTDVSQTLIYIGFGKMAPGD